MIGNSTFRLMTYQGGRGAAPKAGGSPPPAAPARATDAAHFSLAAPLSNAQVHEDRATIEQQLGTVQQECLALMAASKPAPKPTPKPAPAPAPQPSPNKPCKGGQPAPAATRAQISKLEGELTSVQQQAAALMAQLKGLAPKPARPGKPQPKHHPKPKTPYGEPWRPGAGSLHGADTSNWQSTSAFDQSIAGTKWSAVKATQGTGYTDPTFSARWNALGQKVKDGQMKLRMAYCFLDAGNGVAQAKHFLSVVGVHGKLPAGTRLALDWEGAALGSPQTLKDAADYIHKVTGLWPVIYVQGSQMGTAQREVPHAPIWEAAWGGSVNRNVPFFQYSDGGSSGIDQDVFNGNLRALDKFAGWSK